MAHPIGLFERVSLDNGQELFGRHKVDKVTPLYQLRMTDKRRMLFDPPSRKVSEPKDHKHEIPEVSLTPEEKPAVLPKKILKVSSKLSYGDSTYTFTKTPRNEIPEWEILYTQKGKNTECFCITERKFGPTVIAVKAEPPKPTRPSKIAKPTIQPTPRQKTPLTTQSSWDSASLSSMSRYNGYLRDRFRMCANLKLSPPCIEAMNCKRAFPGFNLAHDEFHARLYEHYSTSEGIEYETFSIIMTILDFGTMEDQLDLLLNIYNLPRPAQWFVPTEEETICFKAYSPTSVACRELDKDGLTKSATMKGKLFETLFHGLLICAKNSAFTCFDPSPATIATIMRELKIRYIPCHMDANMVVAIIAHFFHHPIFLW